MNLQQLHATPDADLALVLGGILRPDFCKECCSDPETCYEECNLIDVTDANAANEMKKKYVAEFGKAAYGEALRDVFMRAEKANWSSYDYIIWIETKLQSVHTFLACAGLVIERGKDG